jgi:hypothetical protein
VAAVTRTNFDNLNRQFFSLLSPRGKGRLVACVNRGYEVYGFGPDGEPRRLHVRMFTHREFGLTDKADLVDYLMKQVARRSGIHPEDVMFIGDEFGPVSLRAAIPGR